MRELEELESRVLDLETALEMKDDALKVRVCILYINIYTILYNNIYTILYNNIYIYGIYVCILYMHACASSVDSWPSSSRGGPQTHHPHPPADALTHVHMHGGRTCNHTRAPPPLPAPPFVGDPAAASGRRRPCTQLPPGSRGCRPG